MLLLVILTLSTGLLLAKTENIIFQPDMSIQTFSQENGIPSKKIKEYLNIPLETDILTTFAELDITKQQAEQAMQKFKKKKSSYMLGITLVGMLIVFLSLILIGLIINQLSHLQSDGKRNKKKRKKGERKPSFSVSTQQGEPSSDAIVAAITAIYLHELEVEEQNNLLLTWRRTNVSMWKALDKINVPNRNYFIARRSER